MRIGPIRQAGSAHHGPRRGQWTRCRLDRIGSREHEAADRHPAVDSLVVMLRFNMPVIGMVNTVNLPVMGGRTLGGHRNKRKTARNEQHDCKKNAQESGHDRCYFTGCRRIVLRFFGSVFRGSDK